MHFNEVANYAFESWRHSLGTKNPPPTFLLLGPPGTGKTAMTSHLANLMTSFMRDPEQAPNWKSEAPGEALKTVLDLTSSLPEDFAMPVPSKNAFGQDELVYAHQFWMNRMSRPGAYGVLTLDDIAASMPAIQAASRQVVLDRGIHGNKLSDLILITVTANRRQDKSGATTLPAHFRNAVVTLEIEPSLDEWVLWYGRQPHHAPIVSSFLRYRPEHLSTLPDKAADNGSFATPRTWAMLGREYEPASKTGNLSAVSYGLVGNPGREFCAFVDLRAKLVPPEDVLANPQGALPNPPGPDALDQMYAMATGLAEVTAMILKSKAAAEEKFRIHTLTRFLRAVGWCTQRSADFAGTSVHTLLALMPDQTSTLYDIANAAKANATSATPDPLISGIITKLRQLMATK